MLIGPGRAGSDWITRNLQLHPDIFIPRRKVTRFFLEEYSRGIDWYSGIFGDRTENAVGEATVGYLQSETAPELIARLLPDVKLIANLRDPVDRTYSSYGRLRGKAKKGEPNFGISFEEKIARTPRLVERSLYSKTLARWFEYFPRENFLILVFDDMKSDPAGFLRQIYEFLGVDPHFESPLIHQRLNSSATVGGASRLLYRVHRALVRLALFRFSKALDTANQAPLPAINPDTRRRLIDEVFIEDIEELEKILGRDLSSWKE